MVKIISAALFLLIASPVMAKNQYHQFVVWGSGKTWCQQAAKIWRNYDFQEFQQSTVSCSPNKGYLKITLGGPDIEKAIDAVRQEITAQYGKPADVDIQLKKSPTK